ncbi:hypothetical protein SADUNF_Sadunf05G0143800 [Salix dunnii]|uniref:Uncharacterized protein n=1 Tax=Salix dunnii TaxID=1413687 RepID=A0A835N3P8_9ROSI|nr:hypothetical protein SADUNF_Sadunf05G0143800 [Salix dunnii]
MQIVWQPLNPVRFLLHPPVGNWKCEGNRRKVIDHSLCFFGMVVRFMGARNKKGPVGRTQAAQPALKVETMSLQCIDEGHQLYQKRNLLGWSSSPTLFELLAPRFLVIFFEVKTPINLEF